MRRINSVDLPENMGPKINSMCPSQFDILALAGDSAGGRVNNRCARVQTAKAAEREGRDFACGFFFPEHVFGKPPPLSRQLAKLRGIWHRYGCWW